MIRMAKVARYIDRSPRLALPQAWIRTVRVFGLENSDDEGELTRADNSTLTTMLTVDFPRRRLYQWHAERPRGAKPSYEPL
jgi:hypothetical protein